MGNVSQMLQHIVNSLSQENKSVSTESNPANESMATRMSAFKPNKVMVGTITKMGVGTYDALVELEGGTELECVCASSILSTEPYLVGVNQGSVYAEGAHVVVLVTSQTYGIILCPMPMPAPNEEYIINGALAVQAIAPEGGVSKHTEKAYEEKNIHIAHNGRPIDTMPGDATWLNEFMVGLGVLKLVAFLRGSERAKLEMFMLDDMVKLTSGHFQHSNSVGFHNAYNDQGYNTSEMIGSHHQCEMHGRSKYDTPIFEKDTPDITKNNNTELKNANDVKDPYIMPRFQSYLGHMGGLFSFFISNPEKKDPVKLTDQTKDEGLFHTFIDGSGRFFLRSAGGICLQRTDKIAVPKKIEQPWYKGEGPGKPTEKLPFEWSSNHPYARHLQLRDAFAWYTKNAYQRFLDNRKQYYLPASDAELKPLTDQYDEVGDEKLGKEKFSDKAHKDATSYFSMDEDGGITIRGKCGEEICLKGGNVVITCPGNIELRSGKSTVIMGGHDTIIKGKKSVDITATDNDVRIKAQKNLQALSKEGGILLESTAENEGQVYTGKEGEDIVSSGIVLKAANSRVFSWSKKLHLAFKETAYIEAINQGTNAVLYMIVPSIRAICKGGGGISLKTEDTALNGWRRPLWPPRRRSAGAACSSLRSGGG